LPRFSLTPSGRRLLTWLAFVSLAINLRAPITSISPVIDAIRADLGIGAWVAGLLTSIPVLCFGVATPFAAFLLARVSVEIGVFVTLGGVAAGTILRATGDLSTILVGTILIGVALTVGNIVSLMLIVRDFFHQRNTMTGVLVSAMSVGAMSSAALTAPLAQASDWRVGTGLWACLALVSAGLWLVVVALTQRECMADAAAVVPEIVEGQPPGPVWRRRFSWLLGLAFGAHTFMFYGLTAWLPRYLAFAEGMDVNAAGGAASLFQILGLVGSFGVSAAMSMFGLSHACLFLVIALFWFLMPVGLLLAPGLWPVWILCGGIGSGGGFSVIFTLIMERAASLADNRRISSFVQGTGYAVASLSPAVIGFANQVSGSWTAGFWLVGGAAVAMAACGVAATRMR